MANEVVNEGRVAQVIGPVVDVKFDSGELPPIYGAIELTNPTVDDTEWNLILEVAQRHHHWHPYTFKPVHQFAVPYGFDIHIHVAPPFS